MTASEKSKIQVSELGEGKTMLIIRPFRYQLGKGWWTAMNVGTSVRQDVIQMEPQIITWKITDYCTLWTPPTKHNPKGNSIYFLVRKTFQYKIKELMLSPMPESTLCLFINVSHRYLLLILSLFSIGTYYNMKYEVHPMCWFMHWFPALIII